MILVYKDILYEQKNGSQNVSDKDCRFFWTNWKELDFFCILILPQKDQNVLTVCNLCFDSLQSIL